MLFPLSTARVKLDPETSVEVTAWKPVATGFDAVDLKVNLRVPERVAFYNLVDLGALNDVNTWLKISKKSTFFIVRVTRL